MLRYFIKHALRQSVWKAAMSEQTEAMLLVLSPRATRTADGLASVRPRPGAGALPGAAGPLPNAALLPVAPSEPRWDETR